MRDAQAVAIHFDRQAPNYDSGFAYNVPARMARARAVDFYLRNLPPPPGRILDLGSGTGVDAIKLARGGYQVIAIDISSGMCERMSHVVDDAGLGDSISVVCADVMELGLLASIAEGPVAGVLLSFGVVNYVSDPSWLLDEIAKCMAPGGVVVIGTLGRRCLWDLAYYALARRTLSPRWRPGPNRESISGTLLPEWYWSATDLAGAASSRYTIVDRAGFGSVGPPPYLTGKALLPDLLASMLWRLDARIQRIRPAVAAADMAWIALRLLS